VIKLYQQQHSANVWHGMTAVKIFAQGTHHEQIYDICSGAALKYFLTNIKSPIYVSLHFYALVQQVLDVWQKKTQM
jgi:hypothetical protein